MGIVIRTLYNNNNWSGPCDKPGDDPSCIPCFTSDVNIRPPKRDDVICSGHCWEQHLCTDYRWGCTPQGRTFAQAYKGMKVFLAHKRFMGGYTIWATTTVKSVDYTPMHTGIDGEDGFAFINFEPFSPLPTEKQATGLSDVDIVGTIWRQGRFRYINNSREAYLEKLMNQEEVSESVPNLVMEESKLYDNISIPLNRLIIKRVEEKALSEGRTKEEIIREAIAEWLRMRK